MLLVDVFEKLRLKRKVIYDLDPGHFYAAPRLVWIPALKVNKLVYIASRTYRFCWQYEIILVWKRWLSALNQLNGRGTGI